MPPFNPDTSDFAWLVGTFIEIIDVLVLVVFALTFVFLLWQIIKGWILDGGNEIKAKEARTSIFFGVIVLAVMASVWAIVRILQSAII